MGGPNCNSKAELKKGPWTREEDQKLLAYIQQHGHGSWRNLPTKAGLQRCGKSCRLRWTNYLRPDIKRGKFSSHEEKAIIRLHALLGNRWSSIAAHLPKRTDNEIKNYWNTRLKKRLTRMGIDPATHKPKNNPDGSAQSRKAAALSHMAQWEAARLEAEARLARESKLVYNIPLLHKLASPPPRPPPRILAAPPCLDVLKVWQSTAIPLCFFSSPGTTSSFDLQSPTSTLNFSSSSATVPAVTVRASTPAICNDVVSGTNGACGVGSCATAQDSTENSCQPFDDQILHPHYDPTAPIDLPSFDQDYEELNMGGGDTLPFVGEFEDSKNYWNYLLSMVSSPMMEPLLL